MEKIPSFTIDHNRLMPGIYVSRKDYTPSGDCVTTFDIRMTAPNREEPLSPASLHAIEHIAATSLRNNPQWRDRVVYWGPMGCCTGNYLLLQGDLESLDIVDLVRDTMETVAGWNAPIPGASPKDCGNYSFMDLDGARSAARRYVDMVLNNIDPDRLVYPR